MTFFNLKEILAWLCQVMHDSSEAVHSQWVPSVLLCMLKIIEKGRICLLILFNTIIDTIIK